MLKRIFVMVHIFILLMPAFVAYADNMPEHKNDFYVRHVGQIIYLGRNFTPNSEVESVLVKKEPGSEIEIARLHNGTVTYMQYSCLYDGDFWGFTSEHSGWVKLDQMLVLYDYVAFEEDHLDKFYAYSGDYSKIKETRSAIAWPWPGADAYLWTYEDLDTENFRVSHAYKDEEGREWGFVTHLYGSRTIWVCLSDPLNHDIPAFNPAPEPDVWVSETAHVDIKRSAPKNEFSILVVIMILVIALVGGTAVLIRVFWKPNKNKQEDKGND